MRTNTNRGRISPDIFTRNARIFELYEEGNTYYTIAKWYDIDPTRVGQIVRRERLLRERQKAHPWWAVSEFLPLQMKEPEAHG